jgi:uridine phosphorylase
MPHWPTLVIERPPILEYDPSTESVIEPSKVVRPGDAPHACVLCYFSEVVSKVCSSARILSANRWADGEHPLYEIDYQGKRLAVMLPGVGAPLAAGLLEETIAFGCRKFVVCGGCGVLDAHILVGEILVPESAVRDEGTSYHYLPASREVAVQPGALSAVLRVLDNHGVPYRRGKTWTTDAPYRETSNKIAARRQEGCIAVEMDAAGLLAVAEFRGVPLGYLLYGGDDVSGTLGVWNERNWKGQTSVRERLFQLAAEICSSM